MGYRRCYINLTNTYKRYWEIQSPLTDQDFFPHLNGMIALLETGKVLTLVRNASSVQDRENALIVAIPLLEIPAILVSASPFVLTASVSSQDLSTVF